MENLLTNKLKKVKMLAMDVDGTLTDAGMYYSNSGESFKRFYTRDGMGIDLLHRNGFLTAIITQENTEIVIARTKKLKISKVVLGSMNKEHDLRNIAEEFNLDLEEIAYIGDDINDISAMKIAGVAVAPNDCSHSVMEYVDFRTKANGGNGAVRELCELILQSQNFSLI
jgi:YrbI family 3-deoxy-D-manno-octulosonate 8-phosphate phosphatase